MFESAAQIIAGPDEAALRNSKIDDNLKLLQYNREAKMHLTLSSVS